MNFDFLSLPQFRVSEQTTDPISVLSSPNLYTSAELIWIICLVKWLQVYQLQQEKKKLQEDFAQLLKEREQLEERCTSYEHEKIQLGPRLEETKWEVSRRHRDFSRKNGLTYAAGGH